MLSLLPFAYLQEFCADQLGLYSYQNYIEVFIFSFVIYKMLRWLQQDHTKHLVLYVYAYATLMITSYIFACTTLCLTMFIFMPLAILICIIAHQKQLQKNFIMASHKDLTPYTLPTKNWMEFLMRSCLLAAYQNKQIFCILERTDHLASMLQNSCNLYLPIQQEILDLILSSNALHTPSIIWLTESGIINSVNATWKQSVLDELLSSHNQYQAAIKLMTSKTDALVWSIDPTTRLATFWHQGKSLQQITIDQLMTSCKQILYKNINLQSVNKSGVNYAVKDHSDNFAS